MYLKNDHYGHKEHLFLVIEVQHGCPIAQVVQYIILENTNTNYCHIITNIQSTCNSMLCPMIF